MKNSEGFTEEEKKETWMMAIVSVILSIAFMIAAMYACYFFGKIIKNKIADNMHEGPTIEDPGDWGNWRKGL